MFLWKGKYRAASQGESPGLDSLECQQQIASGVVLSLDLVPDSPEEMNCSDLDPISHQYC